MTPTSVAGFRSHLDQEWSKLSKIVGSQSSSNLSSKDQAISNLVKMLTSIFPPPSRILGNSDEEVYEKFDGLIRMLERLRDGESLVPGDEVTNGTVN